MYPWLIASASGQRKYTVSDDSSDEEEDEDEDEDEALTIDNSLKVWRAPGRSEWYSYPATATTEE